jgi:hypothetical protein
LLLATTAKYANYGMNPLWPTTDQRYLKYQNTPAFILVLLAALDLLTRPGSAEENSGDATASATASSDDTTVNSKPVISSSQTGSCLPAAMGLGALLYTFHAFASDAGTFIAWSFEGYPVKGPTVFHGYLTIGAICFGLSLSLYTRLASNPIWWAIGIPGIAVVYVATQWQGYLGGLLYLVMAFSAAPSLLLSALRYSPGRTFFFAWLTYDILTLLSIFTTAYAFVVRTPNCLSSDLMS